MNIIQEKEEEIIVKKEKVVREFREELKLKGLELRDLYDESFFKILNHVYPYHPKNMTCHLKPEWLTFLLTFEHKYVSIAWSEQCIILSITIPTDFEKGGFYTLTSLEEVFEITDR